MPDNYSSLNEHPNDQPIEQTLVYYLLSDAAGQLNQNYLNSVMVQFPTIHFQVKNWPFIQYHHQLESALTEANAQHANILGSFVDPAFDQYATQFCSEHQLHYVSVMQPLITHIEKQTGIKALQQPGNKAPLDNHYYHRVECLEFAVENDDGQNPDRFDEADILLLGISRTGKTPLSIYLAFQGYKVANLPLLPESKLPDAIYEIDKQKIVGLTTEADVLNRYRKERLRAFGLKDTGRYNNDDRIAKELSYADAIYQKLDCPVINVAERSIEETATLISLLLDLKRPEF
ncbi:MAG: kinase/pyrophosphorylase [Aerococcus sp.]|nr:kinase/pyrophosphorylase [Aerococcus sp.]